MNKHVNKLRKAAGRAEAIAAQNKQQYLIKEKERKHRDRTGKTASHT